MDFVVALDRMVTAEVWTLYGSGGRSGQGVMLVAVEAAATGAALAGVVDSIGRASAPSIAADMAIRVERMRKKPP
ncbi:hypothetical protein GCM10018777_12060 [Streptomyces albogriseolus]|nr:hypothetical protein GCM10018777_12060 [Streptomyces viridodiastaticus]